MTSETSSINILMSQKRLKQIPKELHLISAPTRRTAPCERLLTIRPDKLTQSHPKKCWTHFFALWNHSSAKTEHFEEI